MHRAWTNLLLMIVICIAIFIIFIALRPAEAGNITDWKCGESVLEVAAHKEFPHKKTHRSVALSPSYAGVILERIGKCSNT